MPEETQPTSPASEAPAPGVTVESAGAVAVGGDVAGRDVVKTTTQVGFSASAVQRLLLTVGVLVFITAACFFTGGVVVGSAVVVALNRPVAESAAAADSMQAKLDTVAALPAGAPFEATFTEAELNSYWRLKAGPQVGLTPGTGAARVLDDGRLVLAGHFAALGNLRVAAVLKPQVNTPGQPFQVDSVAVQVVSLGNDTSLGWLPLPASAVQAVTSRMSTWLDPGLELTSVRAAPVSETPALTVGGVSR